VEAETVPAGRRRRIGPVRLSVEAVYVVAITVLAAYGMSAEVHRPVLVLAAALALPFSVVALVGLYVLTGVFNSLASGFSNSSVTYSSGGCTAAGHCWSRTWGTPVGARGFLFAACVVALFTGAALGNVLVLRGVQRARDRRMEASRPWPAPRVAGVSSGPSA
jgi:hypothetical protein